MRLNVDRALRPDGDHSERSAADEGSRFEAVARNEAARVTKSNAKICGRPLHGVAGLISRRPIGQPLRPTTRADGSLPNRPSAGSAVTTTCVRRH